MDVAKENGTAQQYCDAASSHVPVVKTSREANMLLEKLNSLMVMLALFYKLTSHYTGLIKCTTIHI